MASAFTREFRHHTDAGRHRRRCYEEGVGDSTRGAVALFDRGAAVTRRIDKYGTTTTTNDETGNNDASIFNY
jgi:hypothetical protein